MLSPLGHRPVVLFDSTADKKNIMAFDLEPTGSVGIKQMKSSLRTLEPWLYLRSPKETK